jgi:hypothetical protein
MQVLRHSQIAMTMEIYSGVLIAKAGSALKRLGRQPDGWLLYFVLYEHRKPITSSKSVLEVELRVSEFRT